MTTIKKLSIQGVRSYSDREPEVIEFLKPLTIIVGANGSGKTTIIEALKFACTGSIPPLGDGGKSFVHDPMMVGQESVKAQIKLGFCTVDDRPVLAIRSFQLLQKKTKREFKNLESILRSVNDENQQVSISHRCADMEKQVPMLMGVSKAVLENVIFCHQEDATWPLSEPKVLKQKFDDIFSATRFTKALDVIAKLRRTQAEAIKLMAKDLEVLDNNMESAHRLEDDLHNTRLKIKSKEDKTKEIEAETKEIQVRLQGLDEKAEEIAAVKAELQKMSQQREIMTKEMGLAHSRIGTVFEDSDEALQELYARFTKEMQAQSEEMGALERQERDAADQFNQTQNVYESRMKSIGKFEAQAAALHSKQQDLRSTQEALVRDFGLKSEALSISPGDFCRTLEELSFNKKNAVAQHKQEADKVDHEFERTIASLQKKLTEYTSSIASLDKSKKQDEYRLGNVVKGVKEAQSKLVDHTDVQKRVAATEAEMREFDRKEAAEQIPQRISATQAEMKNNTNKLNTLLSERKALASQQQDVAQLQVKRDTLNRAVHDHNNRLTDVLRALTNARVNLHSAISPLPSADVHAYLHPNNEFYSPMIETQLKEQVSAIRERLVKAKQTREDSQSRVSAFEGRLGQMNSEIKTNQTRLDDALERLKQAGVDGNLDGLIAEWNKKVEQQRKKKSFGSLADVIYSKFLKLAEKDHMCALCSRSLNPSELASFLELNQQKLSQVGTEAVLKEIDAKLKQAQDKVTKLTSLKTVWEESQRLQTELPNHILKKEQEEAQLLELRRILDSQTRLVDTLSTQEDSQREALRLAAELSRMYNEIVRRDHEVQADVQRLESRGGRRLDVVQKEIEQLETISVDVNVRLSDLQTKKEQFMSHKQILFNKLQDFKNRAASVSKIQTQLERLLEDQKELTVLLQTAQDEQTSLTQQIGPLKEKLSISMNDRKAMKHEHLTLESKLQEENASVQNKLFSFKELLREVQEYEKAAPERAKMESSLKECKRKLDKLRGERDELVRKRETKFKSLAESKSVETDIQANLEYRSRKRMLARQNMQIEEKRAWLNNFSEHEALSAGIAGLREDLQALNTARAELRGALVAEIQQAKQYEAELKTERYRNIDNRHREKLVEVKTTTIANKDLELYYKALDEALMRFHGIKMKEINNVLKEYWRHTYRGKDIDEVYILSEHVATEKGRRSYNYRVVMKQGDTELNMRGRCSAGQKVLASLLIRLALAETFCLQCGVLALDEPTTNLDEANIKSFAKALNAIIEKRREQQNFQLILITHDDQFVEKIGKRSHADYYYRVYKDIHQHSKIRKQHM